MLYGRTMATHRPRFEPADPAFADRVRADFAMQAAMSAFGIAIVEIGSGWVEFEFAPPPGLTQQDGFVHAGVVATALDSACGYAAMSLTSPQARVLTSGYKVDLLRPATGDHFVARGWVVKPGRKFTVSSADLLRSDGKAVAIMTGTIVQLSALS